MNGTDTVFIPIMKGVNRYLLIDDMLVTNWKKPIIFDVGTNIIESEDHTRIQNMV